MLTSSERYKKYEKRPNKALPFDLKQFQKQIPDLGRTVCAIIEFESAPAAKFAVDTLKFRTQELKFRLALLEPGVSRNRICSIPRHGKVILEFLTTSFYSQKCFILVEGPLKSDSGYNH